MNDELKNAIHDYQPQLPDYAAEWGKMYGEIPIDPCVVAAAQAETSTQPQTSTQKPPVPQMQLPTEIANGTSGDNEVGLFIMKKASEWIDEAKNTPIPKMLFGQLWYEGELCILFADTNLGKSILAVQIADAISRGVDAISGFKLEATKQPVLYFDFELSMKQFEARYSNDFKDHFSFDNNFRRIEINPDSDAPSGMTFDEYLNLSVEQCITTSGAKVVIIDNITYLRSGTEKAGDALPLMKYLIKLKKQYDLSILILAHTPKRNLSNPITRNDLQGSKMLINFCDSCFAIGESFTDKSFRYIKQIKQRNCAQVLDADNVAECEISKPTNFVRFEFRKFSTESAHLQQATENDKEERKQMALALSKQGKTQREIATQLGISVGSVNRLLK